jgi:hypothetical protein
MATATYKVHPVFGTLIAILSAAMNITTIGLVYRIYWQGIESVPYPGVPVTALELSPPALVLLFALNVLAGRWRPPHWFFKWVLDFIPSILLAIALIATGILLFWGELRTTLFGLIVLGALLGESLFDVIFNQLDSFGEALIKVFGKSGLGPIPRGTSSDGTAAPQVLMTPAPNVNVVLPQVTDAAIREVIAKGGPPLVVVNNMPGVAPAS